MFARARRPLLALLAALSSAAASAELPEGLAHDAVLCMTEPTLPEDLAARRPAVEGQLREALERVRFRIVAAEAVSPVAERVEREIGGFVDRLTGERDWPRYREFVVARGRAFRAELGCDAELRSHVALLRIAWLNGEAKWDGLSTQVSSQSRLMMNLVGGRIESGYVGALSLWVGIWDLEGRELAFRSGGIELLATLESDGWHPVPPEQVLSREDRLRRAVAETVGFTGQLLRKHGKPDAPK